MNAEVRERDDTAVPGDVPSETVDSADLRGGEQELAAGRSALVPFSLLTWVTVVIGGVVVVVVALAALAYVLA